MTDRTTTGPYTPTTQYIRDRVRHSYSIDNPGLDGEAMFDAWLDQHDADLRTQTEQVLADAPATAGERAELAELREMVASLRAGVLNLTRDELVQRVTAVGSAEWKAGNWLSAHDARVARAARTVPYVQIERAAKDRFVAESGQAPDFAERIWDNHSPGHPVKLTYRRQVTGVLEALGMHIEPRPAVDDVAEEPCCPGDTVAGYFVHESWCDDANNRPAGEAPAPAAQLASVTPLRPTKETADD